MTYLVGPKYILGSWPEGYKMFVHYKGPQDDPRVDKYLIGASPCTEIPSPYLTIVLIRLNTCKAFSLGPGIRTSCCVAHGKGRLTSVQLCLQVLHAHAPGHSSSQISDQRAWRFFSRFSNPPVGANTCTFNALSIHTPGCKG